MHRLFDVLTGPSAAGCSGSTVLCFEQYVLKSHNLLVYITMTRVAAAPAGHYTTNRSTMVGHTDHALHFDALTRSRRCVVRTVGLLHCEL
jgi:hypothetical protein